MRYITGPGSYLVAVSFGADIECDVGICTEYAGGVPAGYTSLDAWYLAECEQLWKWRIVNGSLVYDANAVPPELPEEPEEPDVPVVDFDDVVIEHGIAGSIEGGWHYRKWRSGYCELWTKANVLPPSSIQVGGNYYSDICTLNLPFRVWAGVVTGSAHFLHWVSNAEVWEDGMTVGFRLMRSTGVYTDNEVPVQIHVRGQWVDGVLPTGYTRLEYLEGTEGPFINTGFKPNSNSRIVIKASGSGPYAIYGTDGGGASFKLAAAGDGLGFYWGGSGASKSANYFNQVHTYEQDKNLCYVDGSLYHTFAYSEWASAAPLALFCSANQDGDVNDIGGTVRIYYCKIYDNGTLVRDLVPVRHPDGTLGMYDLLDGRFRFFPMDWFVAGPALTASN